MIPHDDIWRKILKSIQGSVTKTMYDAHFAPIKSLKIENSTLVLACRQYSLPWLEFRLSGLLTQAIKLADVPVTEIQFVLSETTQPVQQEQAERFRVRDRRSPRRYFVDNVFLRWGYGRAVGPYGIAIYNVLVLHAGVEDQDCWPSYKTMAFLTGMSRRQAIREVKKLSDLTLIEVASTFNQATGRQTSNTIWLTHYEEWKILND
jgi:chromosomal replication initiation ATPase DnaA